MTASEFEEREYEQPLYRQLERTHSNFWSPGQVLESYLGFDRALYLASSFLWDLHGWRTPLPGVMPFSDYWHFHPHFRRHRRRLPDFRLNCFLQAKRSFVGKRLPKRLAVLGYARPYYKFEIEVAQQDVLSSAASQLAGRALFAYAAPVFATSQRLFFLQQTGEIAENSTFPEVRDLNGHEAWYYAEPGAKGVANPEVERIDGPDLFNRIQLLLDADRVEVRGTSTEQLAYVARAIRSAVFEGGEQNASARRAYLIADWHSIEEFAEVNDLPPAARSFLEVAAFCTRFRMTWLVLGQIGA